MEVSKVIPLYFWCIENDSSLVFCLCWQGIEDYYGDMDFKMAGTNKGITALQVLWHEIFPRWKSEY